MPTLIDTNELLHAYLSSVTSLTDVVTSDSKVWLFGPPGLPTNFTLRKALSFDGSGGMATVKLPLSMDMYQIRTYGITMVDAYTVYRALFDALGRRVHTRVAITGGNAILQHAQKIGGPDSQIEPMTEWPVVISTWNIHFYERIVA